MTLQRTWKRSNSIIFFESLESYLSAGLSLDTCIRMIGQSSASYKKNVYTRMNEVIERGGLFSDALAETVSMHITTIHLIRHGESSGDLLRSITLARSLLEHQDELIKNCLSAMAYPCIIGFFAIVLVIGLIRGVMPQIIPMLIGLHVQLPILTRIVISMSDITTKYGLYIVLGICVCISSFVFIYKRYEKCMYMCHVVILHIPIIGKLVRSYATSVFLHSCGALLDSGVGISKAYPSTTSTISVLPIRSYMSSFCTRIDNGAQLSSVFYHKVFPPYISALISAGESSGTLGQSCIRAALITDRNMKHSLKRLTSLIEPIMMVGMGLIIGAIALSILMPIYDISKVLQK